MKQQYLKGIFMPFIAIILMAFSTALPAHAVEPLPIIGGIAMAGGGIALASSARDDRLPGENAIDASPGKAIGGIVLVIGGTALAISGLIADDQSPYSDSGVISGVSFGYTDSGKMGIQKKWEF